MSANALVSRDMQAYRSTQVLISSDTQFRYLRVELLAGWWTELRTQHRRQP